VVGPAVCTRRTEGLVEHGPDPLRLLADALPQQVADPLGGDGPLLRPGRGRRLADGPERRGVRLVRLRLARDVRPETVPELDSLHLTPVSSLVFRIGVEGPGPNHPNE